MGAHRDKAAAGVLRQGSLAVAPFTPLPDRLVVGGGTALFVDGICSHPAGITELSVVVGERETPVAAFDMPRPGTVGEGDYWWATIALEPIPEPGREWIRLRAGLGDGSAAEARLESLQLVPDLAPPQDVEAPRSPEGAAGPHVAIAMAAYEPPPELLRRQLDSIRAQTHENWVCVISDDASSERGRATLEEAIAGDPRFVVSSAERNRGFYANFERALSMVPAEADHVALSDQDDEWRPDKLEKLLAAIEADSDARLAYSDMRIVSEDGEVVADTYWTYRRNNHTNFGSLLLANTVTGGASLFERKLLDYALPFPPKQGNAYHDHWIASVAMTLGGIAYVDQALYDYVQHGDAALGHLQANAYGRFHGGPFTRLRRGAARVRRTGSDLGWRHLYFGLYSRIAISVAVLQLRCGAVMPQDRARTLSRVGEGPSSFAWLALRGMRSSFGANETLGRERAMLAGLVWRRGGEVRKRYLRRRRRRPGVAGPPGQPGTGPVLPAGGGEPRRALEPLLVDYFSRDGSTLLMRLLASSPQIAVEPAYPYERKYFAYLWRWAQVADRGEWPDDVWGATELGTLNQARRSSLIGPPPWLPRTLIETAPGEPDFGARAFDAVWGEFSELAAGRTAEAHGTPPEQVRFSAEKHLNTWMVALEQLPPVRLVVLLRDPRDTWVSINSFNERRGSDGLGRERVAGYEEHLTDVIGRQRERLRWIAGLLEEGEVPVVRYEEMIRDLPSVARGLEEWLGVRLDPAAAVSDREMRSRHVSSPSPEASLGRWRSELDDEIVDRFEAELGEEMRALGLED